MLKIYPRAQSKSEGADQLIVASTCTAHHSRLSEGEMTNPIYIHHTAVKLAIKKTRTSPLYFKGDFSAGL